MAGRRKENSLNKIGQPVTIVLTCKSVEAIKGQDDFVPSTASRFGPPTGVSGWIRSLVERELERRECSDDAD